MDKLIELTSYRGWCDDVLLFFPFNTIKAREELMAFRAQMCYEEGASRPSVLLWLLLTFVWRETKTTATGWRTSVRIAGQTWEPSKLWGIHSPTIRIPLFTRDWINHGSLIGFSVVCILPQSFCLTTTVSIWPSWDTRLFTSVNFSDIFIHDSIIPLLPQHILCTST